MLPRTPSPSRACWVCRLDDRVTSGTLNELQQSARVAGQHSQLALVLSLQIPELKQLLPGSSLLPPSPYHLIKEIPSTPTFPESTCLVSSQCLLSLLCPITFLPLSEVARCSVPVWREAPGMGAQHRSEQQKLGHA